MIDPLGPGILDGLVALGDAAVPVAVEGGRLPKWLTAILAVPLLFFLPYFYLRVAPRWRTGIEVYDPHAPPVWWALGAVAWRAVIRVTLPLGIVGMPFVVAILVLYFVPDESSLALPLGIVATIGIALSIYIQVSVGLFNRPRALVPPPYRRWPGAWQEWSGGLRFEQVEPTLEDWEQPHKRASITL